MQIKINFVFLFFFAYFLLGTSLFTQYGISWDEPYQRQLGYVNFEYIRGDQSLLTFTDRYYGPAFELPLVIIERVLGITDTQTIYYLRHYFTFLLFFGSTVIYYFLNKKLFKSRKIAILGAFFLILNPRTFSDSFYNSKDIPLLAMFIISSYSMVLFLERKDKKSLFFHSLASALVIATRIIGGLIPVITVLVFLATKKKTKSNLFRLLFYVVCVALAIYAFWPVLWTDPFRIFEAISKMANFAFQTNLPTLYMGKFVSPFSLPWHYLPVWIGITLPLSYIALFILGVLHSMKQLIQKKLPHHFFIFALILFTPIISAIVLDSTLYDGWRHFYFIYPFIVIFMLQGLRSVPKPFYVFIGLELLSVIYFMVAHHPYQHLYFNSLINKDMQAVKQQYELDYWGLSYKEALQYIVSTDRSKKINIVVANNPGNSNSLLLKKEDQERLHYLSEDNISQADYFVGNYRWHPADYEYQTEVFSVEIRNAKIVTVYKLK